MDDVWIKNIVKLHASAKQPLADFLNIHPTLRSIMEDVSQMTGSWNLVELYTAVNAMDEKRTFLEHMRRNGSYTPRYLYPQTVVMDISRERKALDVLTEKLSAFSPQTQIEQMHVKILQQKLADDSATCNVIKGIQTKDDALIGISLSQKYPGTDPWLIAEATRTYEELCLRKKTPSDVWGDQRIVDLEEAQEAFRWALAAYDSDATFPIVIDPFATAVDVRDKSISGPRIVIPSTLTMSRPELLLLMTHEIEAHVRQTVNGKRLFGILADMLRCDDETLYEGLAMRHELSLFKELHFEEDLAQRVGSSCRTIFAVQLAEQGASFQEVYEDQLQRALHVALCIPASSPLPAYTEIPREVLEGVENSACYRTYRVMRGHTDCTNKARFAMAKDLAYFRGWLLDSDLEKEQCGYLNEAGILSEQGLEILASFAWGSASLPYQYTNMTKNYTSPLDSDSDTITL